MPIVQRESKSNWTARGTYAHSMKSNKKFIAGKARGLSSVRAAKGPAKVYAAGGTRLRRAVESMRPMAAGTVMAREVPEVTQGRFLLADCICVGAILHRH
ncbi:MAG TPA: hypothetical protein VE291_07640 [Terracidiphilus sp.]|jgi:hypothetical protein|nr:hypothetical protein [Terracidiphilus sp.]